MRNRRTPENKSRNQQRKQETPTNLLNRKLISFVVAGSHVVDRTAIVHNRHNHTVVRPSFSPHQKLPLVFCPAVAKKQFTCRSL